MKLTAIETLILKAANSGPSDLQRGGTLQMPDLITPPTPDELCPHVQTGAEKMTGGWVFAANDPPIAVGMCHNCITWCKEHLSTPTAWRDTTAITRSRVANSTGGNYN